MPSLYNNTGGNNEAAFTNKDDFNGGSNTNYISIGEKLDLLSNNTSDTRVFRALFPYLPIRDSPNENSHLELPLHSAGEIILVRGQIDEDQFYFGEKLTGKTGLVPSNYIEPIPIEELRSLKNCEALTLNAQNSPSLQIDHKMKILLNNNNCSNVASTSKGNLDNKMILFGQNNPSEREHERGNTGSPSFLLNMPAHLSQISHDFTDHSSQQSPANMNYNPSLTGTVHLPDSVYPFPPPKDISKVTVQEVSSADVARQKIFPPLELHVEKRLSRSALIAWLPPQQPTVGTSHIQQPPSQYHVCVNGLVKAVVPGSFKCSALLEELDLEKFVNISVRNVGQNGQHSVDAACTIATGYEAPIAPQHLSLSNVTPVGVQVNWYPSDSNAEHIVLLNGLKVGLCPAGVFQVKINGLNPSTIYRLSIRTKHPRAVLEKRPVERCIDFKTLPKIGLPDPPDNVQVELGPQPGTLLISWNPVTNQPRPPSKAAVQSYLVFADGQNVAQVPPATADHVLIRLADFAENDPPIFMTVRTRTKEGTISADSKVVRVPRPQVSSNLLNTSFDRLDQRQFLTTAATSIPMPITSSYHKNFNSPLLTSSLPNNLFDFDNFMNPKKQQESVVRLPDTTHLLSQQCQSFLPVATDVGPIRTAADRGLLMPMPISNTLQTGSFVPSEFRFSSLGAPISRMYRQMPGSLSYVPTQQTHLQDSQDRRAFPIHFPTNSVPSSLQFGDMVAPSQKNFSYPVNQQQQQQQQNYRIFHPNVRESDEEYGGSVYFDAGFSRKESKQIRQQHESNQNQFRNQSNLCPTVAEHRYFSANRRVLQQDHLPATGRPPATVMAGERLSPRVAPQMARIQQQDSEGAATTRSEPDLRLRPTKASLDTGADECRLFVALYSYNPSEMSPNTAQLKKDELAFQRHQLIKVHGDVGPDGYYWGEIRGKFGFVPSNTVIEIDKSDFPFETQNGTYFHRQTSDAMYADQGCSEPPVNRRISWRSNKSRSCDNAGGASRGPSRYRPDTYSLDPQWKKMAHYGRNQPLLDHHQRRLPKVVGDEQTASTASLERTKIPISDICYRGQQEVDLQQHQNRWKQGFDSSDDRKQHNRFYDRKPNQPSDDDGDNNKRVDPTDYDKKYGRQHVSAGNVKMGSETTYYNNNHNNGVTNTDDYMARGNIGGGFDVPPPSTELSSNRDERFRREVARKHDGVDYASDFVERPKFEEYTEDLDPAHPHSTLGAIAQKMVAKYDYDCYKSSPNADAEQIEMSFRHGDEIVVFGEVDEDGFYPGENINTGERGLVPSNFLMPASEVNARHIDSRVDRTTDQQHLVTYEVSQSEQQAYGNDTPPTNVKKLINAPGGPILNGGSGTPPSTGRSTTVQQHQQSPLAPRGIPGPVLPPSISASKGNMVSGKTMNKKSEKVASRKISQTTSKQTKAEKRK